MIDIKYIRIKNTLNSLYGVFASDIGKKGKKMDDSISKPKTAEQFKEEALRAIKNLGGYPYNPDIYWAYRAVLDIPTVDAVPVVRCADCKWWDRDEDDSDGRKRCDLFDPIRLEPEFWCAYGERREDGKG